MKPLALAAAAGTFALLSACTTADKSAESPAADSAKNAQSESCVNLASIRNTRVIDDKTIDFYMGNGRILRNTLPYSCPSLGFEEAFTYSTSLTKLCSTDIITVIHQGGGPSRGASCGLGTFVPYTPEPKGE